MNLLIEYSDTNIKTFVILIDTPCYKQMNDFTFIETRDLVRKGETYDATLIFKQCNPYLYLGYDDLLEYDVYLPVKLTNNEINIKYK
jgi:hypothetical protein